MKRAPGQVQEMRRPEWNGAQGPVDLGFARTEAERRRLEPSRLGCVMRIKFRLRNFRREQWAALAATSAPLRCDSSSIARKKRPSG